MSPKRILCATDFSTDAASALGRAVMLAAQHGARLEVLHVVPRDSLDAVRQWVAAPDFADRLVQTTRAELESCAAEAARQAGIAIEPQVVVADVTAAILERAAAADLAVLGACGTSPLKDALLGTTAERIAGRSATPLLVVRMPPERPYGRVLVAADLLPGSEEAFAAALAVGGSATLAAVHAFDIPFEGKLQRSGVSPAVIDEQRSRAHREALEKIAGLSRAVAGDANRFVAIAERGHPAKTVLDRQQAIGADLVVLRKRARSLPEALLLGSVTRHVLADAASDVLVLAEPKP